MPSKYVARPAATNLGAVATTAMVDVQDLENVEVSVSGTFVATVSVEFTFDGTNYAPAAAALTAPGRVALPVRCRGWRLNCTAFTSGSIVGRSGGRDPNRIS